MQKFILFYKGPSTPPGASHEKWPAWFKSIGDQLVDTGSPMDNGRVLHSDGSLHSSATEFNGYSIIQARDVNAVKSLLQDHPLLSPGKDEYSIEIFELAR